MHTHSVNEWKKIQVDAPVFDLHIHPAMNRLVIQQNLNDRGGVFLNRGETRGIFMTAGQREAGHTAGRLEPKRRYQCDCQ